MNLPLSGDWITHRMKFVEIKAVRSMEKNEYIRCRPKETSSTLPRVMSFMNVAILQLLQLLLLLIYKYTPLTKLRK